VFAAVALRHNKSASVLIIDVSSMSLIEDHDAPFIGDDGVYAAEPTDGRWQLVRDNSGRPVLWDDSSNSRDVLPSLLKQDEERRHNRLSGDDDEPPPPRRKCLRSSVSAGTPPPAASEEPVHAPARKRRTKHVAVSPSEPVSALPHASHPPGTASLALVPSASASPPDFSSVVQQHVRAQLQQAVEPVVRSVLQQHHQQQHPVELQAARRYESQHVPVHENFERELPQQQMLLSEQHGGFGTLEVRPPTVSAPAPVLYVVPDEREFALHQLAVRQQQQEEQQQVILHRHNQRMFLAALGAQPFGPSPRQ
jgi:hypothetical protein